MKELWRSLVSMVRFCKVVGRWRWWDYQFDLDLLARALALKEREWLKHTRYYGDTFTRKRIQVLLRMYEEYRNAEVYTENEKLKRFLKMYARNAHRFWN